MQPDNQLIFNCIEELAPLSLAEDWDNSGLQVGNPAGRVSRVLIALDMDERVLEEALDLQATLVVTHHPMILKGIRQIREDSYQGRLLTRIIKSGITVYAAHTNLDIAGKGVNGVLADLLGLSEIQVLKPAGEKYYKLAVFVPLDHLDSLRAALSLAGAGFIGNYSHCSFSVNGLGTYMPKKGAKPYLGKMGVLERAEEAKLETIIPARLVSKVLKAMEEAHPYEEIAHDLYSLENANSKNGLGRLGLLNKEVSLIDLVSKVKEAFGVKAVRYGGLEGSAVSRVALCGGSGSDFWPLALSGGAEVFITGDISYHTAKDMLAAGISFIDPGHYWTEQVVIEPLAEYLREWCTLKGVDLEIIRSSVCGDPFKIA
ncbi:MAG: Nif3-like dinuclear metal center hexameric protein [Peptococcaceae bacterium]|nr:Nif3-like dinuclear metal center hexameric protein [Peptococcaceae bacterium]